MLEHKGKNNPVYMMSQSILRKVARIKLPIAWIRRTQPGVGLLLCLEAGPAIDVEAEFSQAAGEKNVRASGDPLNSLQRKTTGHEGWGNPGLGGA